jgi:hypothetical protein
MAGFTNSKEDFMQKNNTQIATTITKRIGTTVYKVSILYSEKSTESINDKIIRLIKNDPAFRKAAG